MVSSLSNLYTGPLNCINSLLILITFGRRYGRCIYGELLQILSLQEPNWQSMGLNIVSFVLSVISRLNQHCISSIQCYFAKAVWFTSSWNFKIENLRVNSKFHLEGSKQLIYTNTHLNPVELLANINHQVVALNSELHH